MVFRKLADYSKAAIYSKVADYSKVVDYSKAAVYKCKPAVYTCKVLNSRFTTVLLITLLDTVEVTPFFQMSFVKQWFTGVNCCFTLNHHFTSCKLPLYCKPPLYYQFTGNFKMSFRSGFYLYTGQQSYEKNTSKVQLK